MPHRCSVVAVLALSFFGATAQGQSDPPEAAREFAANTDQDLSAVRQEVAQLNARLAPGDELTAEQVARLTRLLLDVQQIPWYVRELQTDSGVIEVPTRPHRWWGSRPEEERYLSNLEAGLRSAEQRAALMLERLPRFLTPAQVRVYAQLAAEDLNRHHAAVEAQRRALGVTNAEPDADRTL